MSSIIKPLVHLNGTSRASLEEQYLQAIQAVREAQKALTLAYPNGRDYYPLGADASARAMAEHRARVEKLTAVEDELVDIYESILG